MLGFFIGIIYANLIAKSYVTTMGIFNEYFLEEYTKAVNLSNGYIWYILRIRLLPLFILGIVGSTKYKKTSAILYILWTGFSMGVLAVGAVVRLGMKGIILCFIGMTPQFIFYVIAYVIIIWYLYAYPTVRWSYGKLGFVICMMGAGIGLEVMINPVLMKMFLHTLQ